MAAYFGQLFLWAGFIGGAFYAVRFPEVVEDPWSTIPWGAYGTAIAVGVVGVILLRASSKADAQSSDRVESEYAVLQESMQELVTKIAELRAGLEDYAPSQIVSFIDRELTGPLADFAESRNALVQRFGLKAFADVMTQFASGERFVNRAWSAAADGYVEESASSLTRAEKHFLNANQQMTILANSSDSFA